MLTKRKRIPMKNNLFEVYNQFEISLAKGEGSFVYDEKGESYLDLYAGHGVVSIGHSHPEYVKAITDQVNKIGFYSNAIKMPMQELLAKRLTGMSGYFDYNLFLCNSGAEANENALKLASFHTGRKKMIAFNGSFHGRTAAALNVTDNIKISAPINEGNYPVVFLDLNDEQGLIDALSGNDISAVIIEGIQGVGGLDEPSVDYLLFLSEQCKKYGTMLILDEIQSGYQRTGNFFAHQIADIKADIISMAKGMGNGFPIGGVLINPMFEATSGMLGTTFGGNQLACAAGIAVLDTILKEKIKENVLEVNSYLLKELSSINAIKQIKGRGLMLGIELSYPIKDIRSKLLFDYHIFTGSAKNPNLLRLLPPLNITKEELKPFVIALKELLS